jgi:hypothetical protein
MGNGLLAPLEIPQRIVSGLTPRKMAVSFTVRSIFSTVEHIGQDAE